MSMTQAWLIFTPAQHDTVLSMNVPSSGVIVIPRVINNLLANNIGEGVLIGNSVCPARLLNDPEYTAYYEFCSTLPIRTIDSDVLFLPDPEV